MEDTPQEFDDDGFSHIEEETSTYIGALDTVTDFIADYLPTEWPTIVGRRSGNSGGIFVIPEKLHVRKEAGHTYYRFDMQLLGADHVLGI